MLDRLLHRSVVVALDGGSQLRRVATGTNFHESNPATWRADEQDSGISLSISSTQLST
ncbi:MULTISPECIES: hypothetical protein [unclassified Cryobacterium]|uniref:hypothetical protein n=1 Tax=unclassified Cryobacterium TaxID=2649013 RepID=UPI002AB460E2|nr:MULTISPECIES: hypothetical protein [unclassified Cryobacterium]MDY7530025.1 hypothetical protein [Cryobacterium sp. 10C2]MDY7555327.1 hypothetical protein [Cryobacterium sp. 10C3]MEB0292404.1 hypothetical protein [Cryobacterium sp. 10C2]